MPITEFIIALIDRLAWPLVTLIGLACLRAPLSGLLPLTRKLKFKELELEFGQDLELAQQQAEDAFPELKTDTKTRLLASAENMPNSAVLQAWTLVNSSALALLEAEGQSINTASEQPYKLIEQQLIKLNLVETKISKLFNELRSLRNKVAHAEHYPINQHEASQYVELCFRLSEHFDLLTKQAQHDAKQH